MFRIGQRTPLLLFLVSFLLCLATLSRAQNDTSSGPPADPFLDPKDDPYNPLKYIASNTLTGIAFALVLTVALIHTFYMKRYGAIWMAVMVVGEYTYVAGFGARFGLHYHPDSNGIYIAEYLLVVLSPCAFIAADYILLGRLSRHIRCTQHVLVPAHRLTVIFVSSDVTTFLIQAAGGVLNISQNVNTALMGSRIFFAGLILQLVSFLSFSCITAWFVYKVHREEPAVWTQDAHRAWYRDWRALAGALLVSCVAILVRSGYRVAELAQGLDDGVAGYLTTTEAYFYGLDALPLFTAISVYVFFWPGRFIPKFNSATPQDLEATQLNSIDTGSSSLGKSHFPPTHWQPESSA
ncbi:RTA1-domain-containing protein [Leucogyrophana mollusca]|uniref:RTA1-domain-containing protein n=1 Tax=Leucogyrophana mollusca TaxID=85980 RepID=A0ACB8AVM9_9AGAM|nr:RTA1-domain-containing protein [Leucogyrophana mollusca]